jgi:hypothetical protein
MFSGKVYLREGSMADLKIRVFKGNEQQPETTVTIPGGVLKVASKLIPKKAAAALQDKGIDLDEIVRLSEDPDAHGRLVEIEEHQKNERVVISLE